MKEPIKIFLSYASEDFEIVNTYYQKLQDLGCKPWMDKKDLYPGQLWEHSIWKAIKSCDFIIIFLSKNSSSKRGFIQREIRESLKLWEEKLDEDIFLIPVKINECEVPTKLSAIQWVNLFDENGFNRLKEAILLGAKKIGKSFLPKLESPIVITKKVQETQEKKLGYNIDVKYPQIDSIQKTNYDEINHLISGWVFEIIQNFRKGSLYFMEDEESANLLDVIAGINELWIDYKVHLINSQIISIEFVISHFGAGAAHPFSSFTTFNYKINPTIKIEIGDVFDISSKWLEVLSYTCIEELINQIKTEIEDPTVEPSIDEIQWINEGAGYNQNNFLNFCVMNDGLIFLFNDYQVGPYSWGLRKVFIPYSKLPNILNIRFEKLINNKK